jgi:hypothetical protein
MDMTNAVTLPSAQERVWEALNDPEILKQCINGCESIEKSGENEYKVALTVAIGPVKAKFKGNLRLTDIDPPNAYTLQFDGQGGVAGFGKGSAKVTLTPDGTGTRLAYTVNAQIGGKIAQVGSRLIDGTSKKMADDFFAAFKLAIAPADGEAATDAVPAASAATASASASGGPGRWRWALAALAAVAIAAWYAYSRH